MVSFEGIILFQFNPCLHDCFNCRVNSIGGPTASFLSSYMMSPSIDTSTQKVPVPYVVINIHIRNGTVHIKDIFSTDIFIEECF
jgi:hypothetical protein